MSQHSTYPADLGLALRVFADPSGSNPVWSDIFRGLGDTDLPTALWRMLHRSPSFEDRQDEASDARELAFLTLSKIAFTDLIEVYRIGLARFVVRRVRNAVIRRRDERKCSFFGISWETTFVPGKKIAKLVGEGMTAPEAIRALREDPSVRFDLSDSDGLIAYAAYRAQSAPIRTGEDDEEGIDLPMRTPSAEEVFEESDAGIAQRLRDSFGDALDESDIDLLVRLAQDDSTLDRVEKRAEIQRARRRIKRVAPAREDVLAAILGTRTAVAA